VNEGLVRKFIAEQARTDFWVVIDLELTYIDVEVRHGGRYWARRRILNQRGGARKWVSVTSALAWLYKEGIQHAHVDLSQWQPGRKGDNSAARTPQQRGLGF